MGEKNDTYGSLGWSIIIVAALILATLGIKFKTEILAIGFNFIIPLGVAFVLLILGSGLFGIFLFTDGQYHYHYLYEVKEKLTIKSVPDQDNFVKIEDENFKIHFVEFVDDNHNKLIFSKFKVGQSYLQINNNWVSV